MRLKAGVNRIGRSVDNHFQIPDSSVSSAHCEILFSEADIVVRDLGSTNGTFINGEKIREGVIRLSQILQVGSVELRLEEAAEEPRISIPELPTERLVASSVLEDGSMGCANHPEVPGTYLCTKCQQALCDHCIRVIRRITHDTMIFCSLCNGQCAPLQRPETSKTRKESFLSRLSKTLKLGYRKK